MKLEHPETEVEQGGYVSECSRQNGLINCQVWAYTLNYLEGVQHIFFVHSFTGVPLLSILSSNYSCVVFSAVCQEKQRAERGTLKKFILGVIQQPPSP